MHKVAAVGMHTVAYMHKVAADGLWHEVRATVAINHHTSPIAMWHVQEISNNKIP